MSMPMFPLEGRQLTREEVRVIVVEAQMWQKRADRRRVNLSKANLIGVDLREADLSEAHLEAANLEMADVRGAVMRGVYLSQANLRGVRLSLSFKERVAQ